jgi:serralysin
MEPRVLLSASIITPTSIVTSQESGGTPLVQVFEPGNTTPTASFNAFDPQFLGGIRVATGDVTGDGTSDIIVGAGPGAGPHVKVFDGVTGDQIGGPLGSFFAFDPGFDNGLNVASGDIDGDGRADVVVSADAGATPHVKVFSGADGSEIRSFFAFDQGFSGGVRVASGDITGDGRDDLVVGAGPGAGPHVKVFDGTDNAEIRSFFAFDPAFDNGVNVATADINSIGGDEIVVSADAGATPHVKAFNAPSNASITEVASFFAYDPSFSGGVRVAAEDVNHDGRDEIFTITARDASHMKVFDLTDANDPDVLFSVIVSSTFSGGGTIASGTPVSII